MNLLNEAQRKTWGPRHRLCHSCFRINLNGALPILWGIQSKGPGPNGTPPLSQFGVRARRRIGRWNQLSRCKCGRQKQVWEEKPCRYALASWPADWTYTRWRWQSRGFPRHFAELCASVKHWTTAQRYPWSKDNPRSSHVQRCNLAQARLLFEEQARASQPQGAS